MNSGSTLGFKSLGRCVSQCRKCLHEQPQSQELYIHDFLKLPLNYWCLKRGGGG